MLWQIPFKDFKVSFYVFVSAMEEISMELLGHCCDPAAYLLNLVSCHNKQLFSANNL